jgi:NitT/TauT family transport system substrate-binding protein
MKIRYKFLIGLATFVFLVSVLLSCVQQQAPLRVGTVLWPGLECLYLARDLGYYKDTSIRLVDYPSSSEVVRAYRNGDLEAAALTLDEVLLLATTEQNVRVVMATDSSYGADVILAKPEIQNLQGLKGRRVGVESTAVGAFFLTRALEQVGMSPKDVQVIPLEVSEHEQAFKKGTVDAIVTYQPVPSKLLGTGAKVLFDSRKTPGEILGVIAVSEQVLTSNSNSLKSLLNGWFRATDYLKKHPDDAVARMAPREGVTAQQFLESLKGLHILTLQENQKLLGKTDASLLQVAKRLAKVMLDKNLLPKAVDPTPLLEDRLVKDVKI